MVYLPGNREHLRFPAGSALCLLDSVLVRRGDRFAITQIPTEGMNVLSHMQRKGAENFQATKSMRAGLHVLLVTFAGLCEGTGLPYTNSGVGL